MKNFVTIKVSIDKFKRMFGVDYDDFMEDDSCDELEVSMDDRHGKEKEIIAIVKK